MIQLHKKEVQTLKKWHVLALVSEKLKLDRYHILQEIKPHQVNHFIHPSMNCSEYLSSHRFKISAVFKGGIRGKNSAVLCLLCVVNYTVLQRNGY
jgi:hypothetical protein